MKNTLSDLNNYMFEQLERINDDTLTGDELDEQLKKSKAMCEVGKIIIDNANLAYRAKIASLEYGKETDEFLIGQK